MRIAIMQPYLFPYLGYFQLIHSVDAFVLYDDVNYIRGGWINRNQILINDERKLITLPLQGASQNKLINQINVGGAHKILKSIRHSYSRAPHFDVVFPMLEDIFSQTEKNLARFLDYQLRRVSEYLGLNPHWYISSETSKDNGLSGQEKILAICEALGAVQYINAIGGKELYNRSFFIERGVQIAFNQPRAVGYRQFSCEFAPNMSIIDVMMFNDQQQCARLLMEYDLV